MSKVPGLGKHLVHYESGVTNHYVSPAAGLTPSAQASGLLASSWPALCLQRGFRSRACSAAGACPALVARPLWDEAAPALRRPSAQPRRAGAACWPAPLCPRAQVNVTFPATLFDLLTMQQVGRAVYTLLNVTSTCYDSSYQAPEPADSSGDGGAPGPAADAGVAGGSCLEAGLAPAASWQMHRAARCP